MRNPKPDSLHAEPVDPPDEANFHALLRAVGARIRELRNAQGISLPVLSELSGVSAAHISLIERGVKNYQLKTADHIARAIGVHTYELFIPAALSDLHLREPRRRQRRASSREPVGLEEQDRIFREFLEHIGSRIRELRKLQGMATTALAHFIGISQQALDNIEKGRTNISVQTADRIADALSVHTHELFIPRDRSEIQYTGDATPKSSASKSRERASTKRKKTTKGSGRARRS